MALSHTQQVMFRTLVAKAWQAFCKAEHLDPRDRVAMDTWRRQQMHAAVGVFSTKDASKTRDFVPLMARFEIILGEDIYWQGRLEGEPLRRLLHELGELVRKHDVEPDYPGRIAVQMFDQRRFDKLDAKQVEAVLIALKRHLGLWQGGGAKARKSGPTTTHDRAEEAPLALV